MTKKTTISNYVLILSVVLFSCANLSGAVIEGTIYDKATNDVIPFVTVQITGSGITTLSNDNGHYRLILDDRAVQLKFSHIGYHSELRSVTAADTTVAYDIYMRPIAILVPGVTVYERQYDKAQKIIIAAIARKKEILEKLHDYSYDAYTKFLVRDLTGKDSLKIMMITETQSTSYWEKPDKYKEILTARQQSSNIPAEGNLATIGEILNFNKNRIDLGEHAVVSPVAEDALKFYNYYLIDSTYIDDRKVYKLEIEPKNQADPLMEGFIQIVDSTFNVISVDVGFNDAVRLTFISNLRYRQRTAQFENEYWMPVQIDFCANVELKFPGVPSKMLIDLVASIHSYSFETDSQDVSFDEYILEVAEEADDIDSVTWAEKQMIPLSEDELYGYERIDSIENAPKPLYKTIIHTGSALLALSSFNYELFHYNRVEGPYLGFGLAPDNLIPNTKFWAQGGYSIDADYWQYKFAFRYGFPGRQKVSIGAEYKRSIADRELITRPWYNSTMQTLFFKRDPFDYYREQGFKVFASTKVFRHTRLRVNFKNYEQKSIGVNTEYSFFGGDDPYRANPVITEGTLRSLGGEFEYDSRKLWRIKGKDEKVPTRQYTLIKVGAEFSSPDFAASDYDYRKYYISLHRCQRTLGLGITTISAYAGSSTRALPPQSYYEIGYNAILMTKAGAFSTLGNDFFSGSRVATIYLKHDFGQYLFRKSGLPLTKSVPFTLSVHGGAFWTDFKNHGSQAGDELINTATTPYTEIGFGVGNITPFLAPFNFAIYFTWQLSDYDTNNFVFTWGFKF